jgi:hypothetical protein
MFPPTNPGSRTRHRRALREGITLPSPLADLDRKKAEIAYEALYTFAFEGYHKTTLGAIARMCRIGRTTIYEYFRNKDEIFSCALKHSFACGYPVMDSSEEADPGNPRIFRFKVPDADGSARHGCGFFSFGETSKDGQCLPVAR